MGRFQYYEDLKVLARKVRQEHGLTTPKVMRTDLRKIFKHYEIDFVLWNHKLKKLRGAFLNKDCYGGPTIMVAKALPNEPAIFTMAHELKHFLCDKDIPASYCDPSNAREEIEIGAEVFGAELIYPDEDFNNDLTKMGVTLGNCTDKHLVHLKRQTSTTMSYLALAKKAYFLGFAIKDTFKKTKWKSLEESIFGVPFYKRFRRR